MVETLTSMLDICGNGLSIDLLCESLGHGRGLIGHFYLHHAISIIIKLSIGIRNQIHLMIMVSYDHLWDVSFGSWFMVHSSSILFKFHGPFSQDLCFIHGPFV